MSRIGLAAAIVTVGVSLTGCTSLLASSSSSDQPQALNFESDPPGAEIRTGQLQTCTTPCALTVPPEDQVVAVSKDGYVPQSVQITTGPPPDHHFWQHPPPTLVPNPVHVELQPVSKPVHHARTHRAVSASAPTAPAQGAASEPSPPPPQSTQGPAARFSAFPPPPSPPKQQ
jgi:hypothetical protein